MEKKLNNENDSTNRKSIDDHERRRQAEKSRAVEQQRRTNTMDGPRLVRDVMIKLGLQRQPAEREYINTKIFDAKMSLEKLTSTDHTREDQRNFESPIPEHQFVHEEAERFQAYERGYAAGLKAQEMTVAGLKNPDVLEGYIKGLEGHRTNLYIGKDVENAHVSQTAFERVNQLLTPAYESRLHNMEEQSLEVKSNGPELGR
ncbi:hypothetical protein MTR80_08265 [Alcaligenes aquatilis]|uniref:Uncharacterized protein n=1 Tax=Alcaligenes aquatilis TaxID=323284 RepID=A0ABY4NPV0_9BURK|nr:hypothetical protein [Alcaligenes aquatilis]UQN37681.1 hypothetical protein MTR80_08265 [Alcaligenes aquatilis]